MGITGTMLTPKAGAGAMIGGARIGEATTGGAVMMVVDE